jgi:hypothetical protein
MTPLFPAQRAAEEFDSVLDGRAPAAVAERYAGLAATAQVLRDQPEVMPRAEFVADLRERLMLAAAIEMVPAAPVVRRAPSTARRNRRLGTVAAALVIVGGSAGMAAAASGALPGDPLYPVKRGIEQVQIAAHVGDASKGSALLDQADTRLGEVQHMLASGETDQSLLDATTADFQSSANSGAEKLFSAYQAGGSSADIVTVRDFTSGAMSQVSSMAAADPSQAGALRDVADTLADLDQQATTLCADCSGGSAITPPGALASSAGAATVTNLIARPITQVRADLAAARAAQTALATSQLHGLQNAAQDKADALGASSKPGAGLTTAVSEPLRGTINSAGQLVPSLTKTGGTAVNDLVGGLTGTVASVSGGGGGGSSGGTSVSTTIKGTGDAVGGAVDGVTGAVNGTVNGTVKGVTDGLDKTLNPNK